MMIEKESVLTVLTKANIGGYITDRINEIPTEPKVNRSEILRLCNEIEDIACDISNQTMNDVVYAEARMIFDNVKAIGKELNGDAGTD